MEDHLAMARHRLVALIGLIAIVLVALTVVDIVREPVVPAWDEVALDLIEKLLLFVAMAAVAWTVRDVVDLRERQDAMANNLARALAQGETWRTSRRGEIAALGQAIEDQFRLWKLTPAEIDIAGLMLKGASLKEIALARDTSEATIRQQAQSVYRKSGLSGRVELSAYFLDSLFDRADELREHRLKIVPEQRR